MGKPSVLDNNARKKPSGITKKAPNMIQGNSDGNVDSLSSIKPKENGNLDKKFMLLKSELQSLFLNPKVEVSKNLSSSKGEINDLYKFKKHQDSISSSIPKQSKFSEWLNDTIEKMDVKSPRTARNKNLDCNKSLPSTARSGLKSKYNMTIMPRYKIERLLYKSFKLQNLGIYVLSSSDESEAEELSSTRIKKKMIRKSKRRSTTFSKSFPRRNFKRKRAPLDSEVEVINLEDLEDSLKEDEQKKIHYVDLDAESYDWSEPFYEKNTSDCSELEIIDDNDSDPSLNVKNPNTNAKVSEKETSLKTSLHKSNGNESFTSPGMEKKWECPICFERSRGQSIVATVCGHIFCKVCLEKHNSSHGLHCPTCRCDLRDKNPIVLYNL